jgi:hypothetical protein
MPGAIGSQSAGQQGPLVELLITSSCPHRDAALALVERVCGQLGGDVEIRVVEVADQQAAEQARFLGSPTIRVTVATSSLAPSGTTSTCMAAGCIRASTACVGCPRRPGCARPCRTRRSAHDRP